MTQQPPPERSDLPAHQLNYASPDSIRPAGDGVFAGQIVRGVAAFFAAVIAGAVIAGMIVGNVPRPDIIVLLAPAIALASLVLLIAAARTCWRTKGFLIGVLTGLGLLLLAIGLCFVGAFR
ncbi:MAG: hypothetical protein ACHRHE_12530 [Tepidisphaerales bacterium]